jgi:hypothetical protein
MDARLIAPFPPSSLRAHLITISYLPMDQNEPVMSEEDDDDWTTESEGETNESEDSEAYLLNEIEDAREALASCSPDHPDRAGRATTLGYHLYIRFRQVGDISLIDEAIQLEREVLALQPLGHPDRANTAINLAVSLHVRYEQAGDVALLDEAIELEREALTFQPPGHPDRAISCVGLAISLGVRYEQTGDVALLDEAIELGREVLALQPSGHPDRPNSCASLGVSLHARYEQTANAALLDEAIELQREATALQPPGHPDRANSCLGLGSSLYERYQQTGDVALLDETIKLEREATVLQPPGHPQRANTCANLSSSLYACYQQTSNVALLDEAIELDREAMALRLPGHPDRANSCASLGSSLYERYQQTSDVTLLDEAIKLQREAAVLRPPGHPSRGNTCANLGYLLDVRYELTGNPVVLDEAIEACIDASEHSSAFRTWYPLTQLSQLHLFCNSPHFSVLKALEYLQQSFQHEVDNIHGFTLHVCYDVALIWDNSGSWTPRIIALLVDVYAKMVDRLPQVAGFVLDTTSRLQSLKPTRQFGSDACVAALLAEQPATAVSLLDRAHGIIWTQALHQRDPEMKGAPKDLAIELEDLLHAIARSKPGDPARLADRPQDLRHRQNARIQAILREIRAMPGLARFMLGSTYETLREAAHDHPVVMLVAARGYAFAVIMPNSANENPDLLPLDVAWNDLRSLADTAEKASLRYRAESTERCRTGASGQEFPLADSIDQERAMRTGNFASEWSPLASLWRDVVKPVLTRLDLMVSHPSIEPI